MPSFTVLTSVEHFGQRSLLGASNGQVPSMLDGNPALGVRAVEGGKRGLPAIWTLVALVLVYIVCHGPELW